MMNRSSMESPRKMRDGGVLHDSRRVCGNVPTGQPGRVVARQRLHIAGCIVKNLPLLQLNLQNYHIMLFITTAFQTSIPKQGCEIFRGGGGYWLYRTIRS